MILLTMSRVRIYFFQIFTSEYIGLFILFRRSLPDNSISSVCPSLDMDEETNWSQKTQVLKGLLFKESVVSLQALMVVVQNMTAFLYSSVQIFIDM